jgi:hypothetical protein
MRQKSCVDELLCKQITNLKLQDFPVLEWVLLVDESEFTHIYNPCQDVFLTFLYTNIEIDLDPALTED